MSGHDSMGSVATSLPESSDSQPLEASHSQPADAPTLNIGPQPLFDTFEAFENSSASEYAADRPSIVDYLKLFEPTINAHKDYQHVRSFLKSYNGRETTFRSYRTQVERLLLWSWIKCGKSVTSLKRTDAEAFMQFCCQPDADWIGDAVRQRFLLAEGVYSPNPQWRPFGSLSKKATRKVAAENMVELDTPQYAISAGSTRQVFAICSSFYKFLIEEEVPTGNPFKAIKQKSKWVSKESRKVTPKVLSRLQWDYVIETAELMANQDPKHERSLFILATLFAMYLRVSDIVGIGDWKPTMGSFIKLKGTWWYEVTGKGNKEARVSVKDDYLNYLKRYRVSRNLTPLPSPGETTPLLVHLNGKAGLTDRHVRKIVQVIFDQALERMKSEGRDEDEYNELRSASLHWLRHTSATFDAPFREMKHLQADLRHENMSTTMDIYYEALDDERADSNRRLRIRD